MYRTVPTAGAYIQRTRAESAAKPYVCIHVLVREVSKLIFVDIYIDARGGEGGEKSASKTAVVEYDASFRHAPILSNDGSFVVRRSSS